MIVNQDFFYSMPTCIEYGVEKYNLLGDISQQYGDCALIVTYKDKSLLGLVEKAKLLLKAKNIKSIIFDEVETNPTHTIVNKGGDLARSESCNLIIGLGGGSAMDTAKAISVIATENIDIWEIVEGREITERSLPVIAIPTTAGTGSEVTKYAVISNREIHRKEGFAKTEFYPRVAILDPLLTLGLPKPITAATGMDALTHAIEAYTTRYANPISDIFALQAIQLCAKNLRRATFNGQDLEARSNMLLANTFAGIAITHADTSLAHVIGEAMGAIFNIGHGLSVALTLPAVMEFNCGSNLEKFATIYKLLEENPQTLSLRESARHAPAAVRELIFDLGLPLGLKSLGIEENEEIIWLCSRPGWDAANMRSASEEDFRLLIKASLSPEMSYWNQGGL